MVKILFPDSFAKITLLFAQTSMPHIAGTCYHPRNYLVSGFWSVSAAHADDGQHVRIISFENGHNYILE